MTQLQNPPQTVLETPNESKKTTTLLVHLQTGGFAYDAAQSELESLVTSADFEILASLGGNGRKPEARFLMGQGKADELAEMVKLYAPDWIIVNHSLSPSQERNLEKHCKCRVMDRAGLILTIFAQRARTHEGKLQVELAQLEHQSTRLVRGWTHLERQRGGQSTRGGPGEKQIELDRRQIADRILQIKSRIQDVRSARQQSRQNRQKQSLPTVALVGYTNAGKSTLFNALTGATVYAANQLFATLDPTLRHLALPSRQSAILADTVGFIADLPHNLIDAFRATLEETQLANCLLHIIDAADPERDAHIEEVQKVLTEIESADIPQILVFNKIDLLPDFSPKIEWENKALNLPTKVWISAENPEHLDLVKQAIVGQLFPPQIERTLVFSPSEGKLRAQCYRFGSVLNEVILEDGSWQCLIALLPTQWQGLARLNPEDQRFFEFMPKPVWEKTD